MSRNRIITTLLLIGSLILISSFVRLDDDPILKIATQLDNWISGHPSEKVYLQLDKPYYAIGDDIWFKAYITIGGEHKLSALSGILNVDLLDDKDSVRESVKLPVINGLTWGDFALVDTLKEGNYRLRAYTNYMRNAGEDFFFNQAITITNSISNDVFTKATYAYSNDGGQQKVNAVINYASLSGAPYVNSQVNFHVQLSTKTVAKGKGQTDDKGNISINFINPNPALFKTGRIATEIKLADKKTVSKSILIKTTTNNVDVQFFPEGGNFVTLNDSKIAFKAVGSDGLGADVKGTIIDDQGKQVTTFSSSHLGMGEFNLKAEENRSYKAKLTYADGSVGTVDLPKASESGYTLTVDESDTAKILVKIIPGPDVRTSNSETEVISLVAQSGGIIYYAAKSKPGSKYFMSSIPKSKFPSGIAQFTLFSLTGEPLNERLVFIRNDDQLKLNVGALKTYAPRQKVKIELTANDKANNPVNGSFSASVTDETKVPVDEINESSIFSNLLLTSDIKGYVEKPGYYFNNVNEKTDADLDVLMLTQGYHRFEWKQILKDTYPPLAFLPQKTLEISGHIKTLGGKPIANGKVTLFSNTGGMLFLDTVSDNQGYFSFKNLYFKDSVKFVIQARTVKDRKNVDIELDTIAPLRTGKNKNTPDLQVNISEGMKPFLENSKAFYMGQVKFGINNRSIMLKEVEITEKKIKKPVEYSSNLNGPGNADQVLQGDDIGLLGCANITDCLQGRLFGVNFRNGVPYSTRSFNRPMLIIIDGTYVDSNFLNDLNPVNIGSIEVLRSGSYESIYGAQGGSGVIIITTKVGGSDTYQHYAPGIITYKPKGYYKAREFYSPQYDNPKTNAQIPDLRSTIYWNPDILTDKNGKASFEYFNAAAKGTYRLVIEGMTVEGKLGRQVYTYEVK